MRIAYQKSKDYKPQREAVEFNKEFLSAQFSFLQKIEFMIAHHFSNEPKTMNELNPENSKDFSARCADDLHNSEFQ